MLKVWRRPRRAKKIGLLNFFLLLIIMIILGFSFLFIHEGSFSLDEHLFSSEKYYVLKKQPLLVKKNENSEVLSLLDFISTEKLQEGLLNSRCPKLQQKKFELHKLRLKLIDREECGEEGKINLQGAFLPWWRAEKNELILYISLKVENETAKRCRGLVTQIVFSSDQHKIKDFASKYSEFEAFILMGLAPAATGECRIVP